MLLVLRLVLLALLQRLKLLALAMLIVCDAGLADGLICGEHPLRAEG